MSGCVWKTVRAERRTRQEQPMLAGQRLRAAVVLAVVAEVRPALRRLVWGPALVRE
jgi:hypothetical protein